MHAINPKPSLLFYVCSMKTGFFDRPKFSSGRIPRRRPAAPAVHSFITILIEKDIRIST